MKIIIIFTLLFFSSNNFTISKAKNAYQESTELSGSVIEAVKNIDYLSLNIHLSDGAAIDTVDSNGNTPLMIASKIGNMRLVEVILAHNPNLDAKNNKGETALMIAAKTGQYYVVKKLIDTGANKYLHNPDGLLPADLAKRYGHSETFKILRELEIPFCKI
jgi:ankyrin repeat protein